MKRVVAVLLFAVLFCGLAAAQSGEGYVFFGPGQIRGGGFSQTGIDFGGGGKYVGKSGLGIGAEMGIAGPTDHFGDGDFGLFSANGYYQFNVENSKLKPFVTGGYSRSFGHEMGMNWGNFGVGANYWFKEKAALLVEFRDHLHRENGVTGQLWTIRFGLSFK